MLATDWAQWASRLVDTQSWTEIDAALLPQAQIAVPAFLTVAFFYLVVAFHAIKQLYGGKLRAREAALMDALSQSTAQVTQLTQQREEEAAANKQRQKRLLELESLLKVGSGDASGASSQRNSRSPTLRCVRRSPPAASACWEKPCTRSFGAYHQSSCHTDPRVQHDASVHGRPSSRIPTPNPCP